MTHLRTCIASPRSHASMFAAEASLRAMMEHVIVPNICLREQGGCRTALLRFLRAHALVLLVPLLTSRLWHVV